MLDGPRRSSTISSPPSARGRPQRPRARRRTHCSHADPRSFARDGPADQRLTSSLDPATLHNVASVPKAHTREYLVSRRRSRTLLSAPRTSTLRSAGVTLAHMKTLRRIASALFVGVMFLVLVPIPWSDVRWGTVPEWICAIALLAITAGVWQMVRSSDRRTHLHETNRVDLTQPTR